MHKIRPAKLNLAIAKRCFVHCTGCYANFGRREPDLVAIRESIRLFVDMGINRVTISGGDPLTIHGIHEFLGGLRAVGVQMIKVDTVGSNLLAERSTVTSDGGIQLVRNLDSILQEVDYLGIPLDGWSNESALLFRAGRPNLYSETAELLTAIDAASTSPQVIVNTVLHQGNLSGLPLILEEVRRHSAVVEWNVCQYIPSDQADKGANDRFSISREQFLDAVDQFVHEHKSKTTTGLKVKFSSIDSRLGKYFLINSDGRAWLLGQDGLTIELGSVFGHERAVIEQWSEIVAAMGVDSTSVEDTGFRTYYL